MKIELFDVNRLNNNNNKKKTFDSNTYMYIPSLPMVADHDVRRSMSKF